jgi:hypothetical protein
VQVIQRDLVDGLGENMDRKLVKGVDEQNEKAQEIYLRCSIPGEELRKEWEIQKSAQISVRSREEQY